MIGFDYTDRIDPTALKAAGCSVVFRYLSSPGWPKNLTAAEARELLDAGIAIVLNYETTATFMLGGYNAGVLCARSARAQADTLGAPRSTRIYYSADFEASPAQIPVLLDFARGAASVDGAAEVGVYGDLRVVQAEESIGFPGWQTIAWSEGSWDPRAIARQTGEQREVGGALVDVNQIINFGALGAWTATPSPAPLPTPSSAQEDDDMPTFATGEIKAGEGAVTIVLPPPANMGTAGWGNAWFSLGSNFGDAHVHVVAHVHGQRWSHDYPDVLVRAGDDRVNPFNGPLPAGVQKISITRTDNPDVPLAWLIEAAHR